MATVSGVLVANKVASIAPSEVCMMIRTSLTGAGSTTNGSGATTTVTVAADLSTASIGSAMGWAIAEAVASTTVTAELVSDGVELQPEKHKNEYSRIARELSDLFMCVSFNRLSSKSSVNNTRYKNSHKLRKAA